MVRDRVDLIGNGGEEHCSRREHSYGIATTPPITGIHSAGYCLIVANNFTRPSPRIATQFQARINAKPTPTSGQNTEPSTFFHHSLRDSAGLLSRNTSDRMKIEITTQIAVMTRIICQVFMILLFDGFLKADMLTTESDEHCGSIGRTSNQ